MDRLPLFPASRPADRRNWNHIIQRDVAWNAKYSDILELTPARGRHRRNRRKNVLGQRSGASARSIEKERYSCKKCCRPPATVMERPPGNAIVSRVYSRHTICRQELYGETCSRPKRDGRKRCWVFATVGTGWNSLAAQHSRKWRTLQPGCCQLPADREKRSALFHPTAKSHSRANFLF